MKCEACGAEVADETVCPECGGDGADLEDSSKDCWKCRGSGRYSKSEHTVERCRDTLRAQLAAIREQGRAAREAPEFFTLTRAQYEQLLANHAHPPASAPDEADRVARKWAQRVGTQLLPGQIYALYALIRAQRDEAHNAAVDEARTEFVRRRRGGQDVSPYVFEVLHALKRTGPGAGGK